MKVFQKAKKQLSFAPVLAHYNLQLPLQLAADSYGVGAVLSHGYPDGNKQPITNASRTLLPSKERGTCTHLTHFQNGQKSLRRAHC